MPSNVDKLPEEVEKFGIKVFNSTTQKSIVYKFDSEDAAVAFKPILDRTAVDFQDNENSAEVLDIAKKNFLGDRQLPEIEVKGNPNRSIIYLVKNDLKNLVNKLGISVNDIKVDDFNKLLNTRIHEELAKNPKAVSSLLKDHLTQPPYKFKKVKGLLQNYTDKNLISYNRGFPERALMEGNKFKTIEIKVNDPSFTFYDPDNLGEAYYNTHNIPKKYKKGEYIIPGDLLTKQAGVIRHFVVLPSHHILVTYESQKDTYNQSRISRYIDYTTGEDTLLESITGLCYFCNSKTGFIEEGVYTTHNGIKNYTPSGIVIEPITGVRINYKDCANEITYYTINDNSDILFNMNDKNLLIKPEEQLTINHETGEFNDRVYRLNLPGIDINGESCEEDYEFIKFIESPKYVLPV